MPKTGTITTTGTQTYTDAVVLTGNTTAAAAGNLVSFGSTVNGTTAGTESLTVNGAGGASFASTVGATTSLSSLSVTNAASLGGNVTTGGNQSYGSTTLTASPAGSSSPAPSRPVRSSIAPRCDDKATTAFFQQQLASFSKDYLQLLSQLAILPGHPRVIINQYYNPFGPQQDCLSPAGLTPAKLATLTSPGPPSSFH